MKTIKIWAIEEAGDGQHDVVPAEPVANTETEELLEKLLVQSPELLMEGLILVGRQVPTGGGPLDLLGIDEDGRLVVFELKRGALTRDAVAQVLDYASELSERDDESIAKMVEDASGRLGIEKIDDFRDFYHEQFPSNTSVRDNPPRMVLVGLGVDDRARRIVAYLTESGVDISLLTFYAFKADGKLLLARQAEFTTPGPEPGAGTYSKESNLRVLRETAQSLGVRELLERVRGFLNNHLPSAYQWPGKTGYSFSLSETTELGNKSYRVYVNVWVHSGQPGQLQLTFQGRAPQTGGEPVQEFFRRHAAKISHDEKWGTRTLPFGEKDWPGLEEELAPVLAAIVAGWRRKESAESEADAAIGDAESEAAQPG